MVFWLFIVILTDFVDFALFYMGIFISFA